MGIDAGSIYSEIRIKLDKLNGEMLSVQASFDKLGTGIDQSTKKTEKNVKDSLSKINLAHVALFVAIGAMIKKSVQGYADFEQSIANVQSVAMGTADEMAKLEAAASKASETTRFTGKQAADALYFLASAGFSARQSVDALDGVLALASATQSDLAFTSSTVAAAISQFNLKASDSMMVANVFAAGIKNSQATMDKLATSMRYVGPIASAFNMQITDTVGVLQILYNAGLEASQAGTALRSVLSDLSNAASPANEKLKALGISFKDIDPATQKFSDIIRALNPIVEKTGAIMNIFGERAGGAMIKLLKVGADKIDEFTLAVTGTDQAVKAANIQNDTLQYSLINIGKAFDSVGKSIVSEFAPTIKTVLDFVAGLLFQFKNLPTPIKVFLGIIAFGIPIVTGLATAIGMLGSILTGSAGIISLVIIGIAGLTAGIIALTNQTSNAEKIQKKLRENIEKLSKLTNEYADNNKKLTDKTKDLNAEEKKTLQQRQELLRNQITATIKNQIDAIGKLTGEIKKEEAAVEKQKNRYNEVATILGNIKQRMQDQIMSGKNAKTVQQEYNTILKEAEKNLVNETTALAKLNIALSESNTNRQEAIDWLANAINENLVEISIINLTNTTLGKEILTRAQYLKGLQKEKETQEKNNDTKKESGTLTDEEIDANKKLEESIKKVKEQLKDLNATDLEKIEYDRERANSEIELMTATKANKDAAIKANNEYYDALKKKTEAEIAAEEQTLKNNEIIKRNDTLVKNNTETLERYNRVLEKRKAEGTANDELNRIAADYINKLSTIDDINKDVENSEREKAMAAIKGGEENADAMQIAIDAVDAYYNKLEEKEAFDKFIKNMFDLTTTVLEGVSALSSSISDLINAVSQNQIDTLNNIKDKQISVIDEELQARLKAEGIAEETTIERLQRELNEAIAAGDLELIMEKEKELRRESLIEDAEKRKIAIEKQTAKESAMIAYKAAHARWWLDNLETGSKQILAIMNAWKSALPWLEVPLVTAATGILIAKQAVTEPKMPALQTGGIVLGSRLGTKAIMGENYSNELALNDSTQGADLLNRFADLLSNRMGGYNNNQPLNVNIYIDSAVLAGAVVKQLNDGNYTLNLRAMKRS